ncbi:MAG TPA: hypothetical protein VNB06_05715 [Thermoanaerobaculia bacterium]|nr:hypothetical protein [Thermoanaerobaculia bacterium]
MLRQLLARKFRNLAPLDWGVEPGCHLLLGGTGAGKTSVLEAIYVVATTRSFRSGHLADCVQRIADADPEHQPCESERFEGEGSFFLGAESGAEARVRLELSWSGPRGLERRLNGERVLLARYLGVQPVLAWTSAEVEMLLGSPGARRRFLDRGVVYARAGSLQSFASHRSLLTQKRSLLRTGGSTREIASWNVLLADAVAVIAAQRAAFVTALRRAFADAALLSGLPFTSVEIEYRPSPASATSGGAAVLEALDRALPGEQRARRPLVGSHRDRLALRWRGEEIASRASAGERKAIGLLLLAAQASVVERERGAATLLIDDADAELDRDTLHAVWPVFAGRLQVMATSNRPEVWEALAPDHRWRVEKGRLCEH